MSLFGPEAIKAARENWLGDCSVRTVLEAASGANRQHLTNLIAEALRFNRPEDQSQVHANDRLMAERIVRHVYGDDA